MTQRTIWRLAVVLLATAVALAGCGGGEDEPAVTETPAVEAPVTATAEAAASEPTGPPERQPEPPAPLVDAPPHVGPVVDGLVGEDEYVHEMRLGGMRVLWANDAEFLRMALVAPGTGYVSVGFDPVDRKVGANYIIGYVDDTGVTLRDHVGTRGNLHQADTEVGGTDDIVEFAGTETDDETILEFVIPLDSGDPRDRPLRPGGSYEIQVAYQESRDDLISWHSRHGVGTIEIDPAP